MAPQAYSVRPKPPSADETSMGAPSRRPRQSSHVAATHRGAQASPQPIGDGCGILCGLGAPLLYAAEPSPGSILWAGTVAGQPGCGLCARRSPGRWLLDSCRLSPSGHTTVGPRPPTRDRILETLRDRTPTRHRLVPIACQLGQATSFA